jgi:hypothetical protein
MKIDLDKCAELDMGELKKTLREIFQIRSETGTHYCYMGQDGKLYLEDEYCEITLYRIYEIKKDNGIFLVIELGVTDIGIIRGHTPEQDICVAGFEGKAIITEIEAQEFLILKIKQHFKRKDVDLEHIEKCLREALLPN